MEEKMEKESKMILELTKIKKKINKMEKKFI